MNKASAISNHILQAAIEAHASDIHFIPRQQDIQIFFRCNGSRIYHSSITKEQYALVLAYYKFAGQMDIGENRSPQQGALSYAFRTKSYSLRFSTLPVRHNESFAIRILPQQDIQDLQRLFLFHHQFQTVETWLTMKTGLILLTGATGSGKSTTLYALLQAFAKNSHKQIITLEDPIEKPLDNIVQVQVNEKAGINYDAGLKAALRHDPDILMIGEIRDAQTAKFAFHAANTGHLVLSTLHANHAQGTIHRLLEMGISSVDIEQNLQAVASIQLVTLHIRKFAQQRAAILDILEKQHIIKILHDQSFTNPSCFEQLRRKAYAFGYLASI
ncbi:Flp pilus assembly complex ATPase component TadA [Gracilibacillus caseinilyticus]|uniref:Flp pilus assembly complex ATPase component TadA n=1 Tax=Gracilibacillus caseinilyticus TaxID=2932256 RepID=A0ABY4ET71_9BACI|nr:competence type IV pilus ATPase ComGA [Gracilibacillus caseinilyticus]UOQ47464.1 Flp pilus assembly complex ATPase component TadA [Gracilibacillus caseinilyticus]